MNQPAKLSKTGITGWRRVTASDLRTSTENSRICDAARRPRSTPPPSRPQAAVRREESVRPFRVIGEFVLRPRRRYLVGVNQWTGTGSAADRKTRGCILRPECDAIVAAPRSVLRSAAVKSPQDDKEISVHYKVALSCQLTPTRQRQWPAVMLAALVVSVLTAVAPAQKPIAALPQVYVDTTWNPPLGGTTWGAHASAQLSNAITHSLPGDVIVLDAGVTYSGAFQLPAKVNPNNKWIYIVSSAIAKLPAGTRVSPASAVNMPKIVTPSVAPAFQVNGGANHWRLAGLELTAASNYPSGCPGNGQNCMTYFLMGSQSNPTPEPGSIALDRCYIHGSPTHDLQTAVQMHASNYAGVDSYIDDVHIKVLDSVGLLSCWSPGPIKIMNNYVAASTENIMLGGCGGTSTPWVPSDVEFPNISFSKPLSWGAASVTNKSMVVKDAFELKSAQRVLFDSNTIENVWANGQTGFAIVLTVRTSQSGDIAVVNDITITNNVLKNVVSGINTSAADNTCGPAYGYPNCHNAGSQDRWYIANNLVMFYDRTLLGGTMNNGIQLQLGVDRLRDINVPLRDVVFQHNTMVAAASTPCSH